MMVLSGIVTEEDVEAIIGDLLSDEGTSRRVYAVSGHDGWVVKEGRYPPYHSNTVEWEVWNEIASTPMAAVFAECAAMSKGGRYLVMERLEPDIGALARPATPFWLKDRKLSCLGVATDGKVKVLDYGNVGGEAGSRAEAAMHEWPSEAESKRMNDLLRSLGDDPFGLGG